MTQQPTQGRMEPPVVSGDRGYRDCPEIKTTLVLLNMYFHWRFASHKIQAISGHIRRVTCRINCFREGEKMKEGLYKEHGPSS